jgi:general stress protein 26
MENAEDHLKNLEGPEAQDKLKELVEKAENCFFCSGIKTGLPFSTRPMSEQLVDDKGQIWFISRKDSEKNSEIAQDPFVQLLFQGNKHSGFISIYGIAEIIDDQQKIDELWQPMFKVWFEKGKNDPMISLIRVDPTQGYYWDTKHGKTVAFLKIAASLITGKAMDDSVEGKLAVD